MRRVPLAAVLAASAMLFPAPPAQAQGACGIPDKGTLWIDFGDGSVPFWQTFAKPGNIVAAANFIYPARIRALGAPCPPPQPAQPQPSRTPARPRCPALPRAAPPPPPPSRPALPAPPNFV